MLGFEVDKLDSLACGGRTGGGGCLGGGHVDVMAVVRLTDALNRQRSKPVGKLRWTQPSVTARFAS